MQPLILDCATMGPEEASAKRRLSLAAAIATMVAWGVNFAFVKHVLDSLGVERLHVPSLRRRCRCSVSSCSWCIFSSRVAKTWPRRQDLPRFIACGHRPRHAHRGRDVRHESFDPVLLVARADERAGIHADHPRSPRRRAPARATGRGNAGRARRHRGVPERQVRRRLVARRARRPGAAARGRALRAYTVLVQPIAKRYGPLIVLCYTLLFSAPPILSGRCRHSSAAPRASTRPASWMGLFWALVVSSFFGWLMWTWVNAVRGVARSAPFAYLMPPIAGRRRLAHAGRDRSPG